MSFMFYECLSLKEFNLNNFNTNNVIDMDGMFWGCSNELIMKIKTQYENIKLISLTLLVLNLERSNSFNDEHPENI